MELITKSITSMTGRHIEIEPSKFIHIPNRIENREGTDTYNTGFIEYLRNKESVESLVFLIRSSFDSYSLNLDEFAILTTAIQQLPVFLVNRRLNPLDQNSLPESLIDASRASAGLSSIGLNLISKFGLNAQLTADQIYEYANGNNTERINFFISEDQQVSCPATKRTVLNLLDKILYAKKDPSNSISDWNESFLPDEINNLLDFSVNFLSLTQLGPVVEELGESCPENIREMLLASIQGLYESLGYSISDIDNNK